LKEVLMELKLKKPSLYSFVKVSRPIFEEQRVVLLFPFRFHRDKVGEKNNKIIIEETLKMVYNKHYKIECVLDSKDKEEKISKDNSLEDITEILDGEIID